MCFFWEDTACCIYVIGSTAVTMNLTTDTTGLFMDVEFYKPYYMSISSIII